MYLIKDPILEESEDSIWCWEARNIVCQNAQARVEGGTVWRGMSTWHMHGVQVTRTGRTVGRGRVERGAPIAISEFRELKDAWV